jgi:hypothetical protein
VLRFRQIVTIVAVTQSAMAAAQAGSDWSSTPAVGLGPLLLRSQSPLNLLQLTPTPLPPITVQRGQLDIGVLESWNNYFDVDPGGRYIIDAGTLGLTIGAGYGITDTLDVSVSLPVTYRGGGILDGFVEWFENGLGVPNKDRRRYPRNQFLVLLHGEDGKTYQFTGTASGWGLEDGTATARYQISRGSETTPAILAGFGVKLPTGRENSFHSSGGTDLEAGVSVGQRLGRFHLYGTASLMQHAMSEFAGVRLRRAQWSLASAVEYRASLRTSYLLQGLVTSPSARDFGDFARPTYEVTFGFKRVLSRELMLEASVLENLFVFDNSPDVGFHVGLVWRSPARRD